jgi:hypothetical protein
VRIGRVTDVRYPAFGDETSGTVAVDVRPTVVSSPLPPHTLAGRSDPAGAAARVAVRRPATAVLDRSRSA